LIWEQHPDNDRYRPAVFSAFFQKALESKGAFAVHDAATGRMIGSSRYHGYSASDSVVEIGWTFLARSHWGGRYNTEMKDLMLTHAFGHVNRALFVVGERNLRSRRAVEKLGATLSGTRVDAAGRISVVYQILAADWR